MPLKYGVLGDKNYQIPNFDDTFKDISDYEKIQNLKDCLIKTADKYYDDNDEDKEKNQTARRDSLIKNIELLFSLGSNDVLDYIRYCVKRLPKERKKIITLSKLINGNPTDYDIAICTRKNIKSYNPDSSYSIAGIRGNILNNKMEGIRNLIEIVFELKESKL